MTENTDYLERAADLAQQARTLLNRSDTDYSQARAKVELGGLYAQLAAQAGQPARVPAAEAAREAATLLRTAATPADEAEACEVLAAVLDIVQTLPRLFNAVRAIDRPDKAAESLMNARGHSDKLAYSLTNAHAALCRAAYGAAPSRN
ncbi:hypothetical protein RVR_P168 (plasmid) [Actinacidiphila reveromycinica]|uniref:Uncharacterized protein n=1 Tax=Actinacidiphila reveromycinica TaxID=659352 RepID=A0A7R6QCL6_9ACTN|nr:hypothetical protein [Streptomyces sp. SN-593]BBG20688.1 hypothetical protein RVR_P168 [Streptomyces sp. SN-593]